MTVPHSYGSTIDLLNEVAEFLEGQADVRDGAYGEQVPNQAMHLQNSVEREIERLKRSSGPSREEVLEEAAKVCISMYAKSPASRRTDCLLEAASQIRELKRSTATSEKT
jgi:hypothetical protein